MPLPESDLDLTLTPLSHADPHAIEALLDAAFGADRRKRTAYRLRENATALPELSFAAWRDETLVGTLQSWPVALRTGDAVVSLTMVGPVAVAPQAQGQGIGTSLMDRLVRRAEGPLVMIGDPEYYERWGFLAAPAAGWRVAAGPYEQHRLLARVSTAFSKSGTLEPSARHTSKRDDPASFCFAE